MIMKTLEYRIHIQASPEKIWKALWDEENYKTWTKPFCDGSFYKTESFTEGSRVHLLTPDGQGMFSVFEKIIPNQFLAFRHLGVIKNFEEQPPDAETEQWTNAMESYELKQSGAETELKVKVDVLESFSDYMDKTFPLALAELKSIVEK